MTRSTKIFSVLIGASLTAGLVWGQTSWHDPMLPPAQFQSNSDASASVSGDAGLRQPTVQVLLIGRDRQSAVIDGRVLKRGEQMEQWRLVTISDKGVLLRDNEGSQTVSAYPAVKKKTPSAPSSAAGSKHKNP